MAKTKGSKSSSGSSKRRFRAALTPEARENQLISLAYDYAEQQILDGTVSSQVLSQLLKAGSSKGRAELLKLQRENELLRAKTETLQSAKRTDELYEEALNAMREYGGYGSKDD